MYYAPMRTFDDVFKAFGGPASYAEAIGIKVFHARTMKQRGSIPPAYWSETVKAAESRGLSDVTLDGLAEAAAESAKAKREGAVA